MPTRLIREGWLDSDSINTLDAHAERFFLRLCLRADDYGRFHANPLLLKAALFPLVESVRSADIPKWMSACENAGLITCYEVDGKRYLEIPKFQQRTRANSSKFPAFPTDGEQMPVIRLSDDRHPRTEAEAYSETHSKAEGRPIRAPGGAVAQIPMLLATPEFEEAWAKWKAHRAEIKHPLKPTSEKAQLDELELMGSDRAIAAIRWTIFKGWRGLREPEGNDARQFQRKTDQNRSLPEPPSWQRRMTDNFADSTYVRNGDTLKPWNQLSKLTQQTIIEVLAKVPL